MRHNLRHLRVFVAVAETGSVSRAGELRHVSQPAVTQAIARVERIAGQPLFERTTQGLFLNKAGEVLLTRVRRALEFLDPALVDISPRLQVTATTAQLQSLIAMREAENFTLAARRLDLAQATVHRAITQLEQEARRPLFERTAYGMIGTKAAQNLALAARLAFAELAQAEADLGEIRATEAGRIVIGAMPLSRAYALPQAIVRFRAAGRRLPIDVVEGTYDDLLAGLRRGEIDFLIGALREPAPIGDVDQRVLFHDTIVLVAGADHPLTTQQTISTADLARYPWVVAPKGAPIRGHFEAIFTQEGLAVPGQLVESRSLILMRELLNASDHLGCISRLQAEAEISHGLMNPLAYSLVDTERPIGLTLRKGWLPTAAQAEFLDMLGTGTD
ncbi:LysR substrate-binding domain-containing protein [Rhizobium halophytocola]|uniref:DNA-binding transcriptional LysR family regulator n=1 Tax=Rhizobium halophytocola TaxID=735519 RepID=A0ABS4DTU7_9HYPH|nr:LysR substrate-binding domain-containing protein [Rhizobium halophytocola]MBP1849113.1 DNA-binding transcriptional LysR family regulator [Rhizobium halophytocola]